jgi:hypothetical protein
MGTAASVQEPANSTKGQRKGSLDQKIESNQSSSKYLAATSNEGEKNSFLDS